MILVHRWRTHTTLESCFCLFGCFMFLFFSLSQRRDLFRYRPPFSSILEVFVWTTVVFVCVGFSTGRRRIWPWINKLSWSYTTPMWPGHRWQETWGLRGSFPLPPTPPNLVLTTQRRTCCLSRWTFPPTHTYTYTYTHFCIYIYKHNTYTSTSSHSH